MQETKTEDKGVLVAPKITIKAPTPEPPPRRKRHGTKDTKEDNGLKLEHPTSSSMVNSSSSSSVSACSWSSAAASESKQDRGVGGILHEYMLKRPALIFLDWMTHIADNM